PFPTRKAWRVGYHVLEIGVSVHTVVLRLPDNGRNLVAPGCVECRALPHFALWCAAKVRDYWRRGLRIPYPPPLIPFGILFSVIGADRQRTLCMMIWKSGRVPRGSGTG